ncbi:sensor histidine kinase [Mycolicibacterium confluentis]|nr:sensor histidine kinase [Mycolicibacterium confluentis]
MQRTGRIRQLGIDTAYILLGFPLATISFSVIVTMLAAGIGTLVVVIGLPIIVGTLLVARVLADIERLRLPAVLRRARTRPAYRSAAPGSTVWRRLGAVLSDGQSWLDVVYALVRFPFAVATFSVVVSWWATAVAGTLTIAWDWAIPRGPDNTSLAQLIGLGDSDAARVGLQTAIGLVCLVSLPWVVRGCALLDAALAHMLLCGVSEMRQTITVLTEQKSAATSAEAHALRRLERDIHDGPQQRLIRLAMDLGRARQHSQPGALQDILDEAVVQTQETLDELRALSRGIAPPVLTDRGLPSALAALAIRCTVPVELVVDPDLGTPAGRLDPAVESTVYFAVAEALTNVAKHSAAMNCWVTVATVTQNAHGPDRISVEIVDNGDGGAHLAKGHGLAGLADRVRAHGGILEVTSPAGGPSTISVELPV